MTFRQPKTAMITTDHEGLREGLRKSYDSCAIVMIDGAEFVCTEQNFVSDEFRLSELIRVNTVPSCAGIEPAPWTGEGLPPVGSKVEIHRNGWGMRESAEEFLWRVVRVASRFSTDSGVDMIAVDGGKEIGCEVFRADMARPIRTPEQIAAESREKAVEAMVKIIRRADWNSDAEMVGELYDAGYRKFETTEE